MITRRAVVIGRFQQPDLLPAHHVLINKAQQATDELIIMVTIPLARGTNRDPLDFLSRKLMLEEHYPHALILPLPDQRTDEAWSAKLDERVKELTAEDDETIIYTGPNGLATQYKGNIPIEVIEEIPTYTGASLQAVKQPARNSTDFRHGVIYGINNKYPITHMTTDVAIIKDGKVLLAKRPGREYYRFPGGFMHFSDPNLEACASRELFEEMNIMVNPEDLEYVASIHVKDWRYLDRDDARIMTTLYQVKEDQCEGVIELNEEFQEYDYIPLNLGEQGKLEVEHRPLFQALLEKQRGTP